jgi:hypothetical protein
VKLARFRNPKASCFILYMEHTPNTNISNIIYIIYMYYIYIYTHTHKHTYTNMHVYTNIYRTCTQKVGLVEETKGREKEGKESSK